MFFLSRINALWHGRFGAIPGSPASFVIQMITLQQISDYPDK